MRGETVAAALERPRNGFAALRFALALAVVVSHGFGVASGLMRDEPLHAATGFTLGEHAVNGFFALSGFLVTMSLLRRGGRDYLMARALRIAPGLVVATLAVALLLGPALSRLSPGTYLADPATWRFVAGTLLTFKSNTVLPGLFEDNALRLPMGTVWTLKYEVLCYAGVLVLGLAGLLSRGLAILLPAALFGALAALAWVMPGMPKGVETALRLPLIFALGGSLYVLRERVVLSLAVLSGLGLVTLLCSATFLYRPLLFAGEAYGVLCLALSPALARPWLDWRVDLSYGTYLYGWPAQQAVHALWPGAPLPVLLALALGATLPLAALSWFAVERPCLALKLRHLGRRTLRTVEPAGP